MSNVFHLYWKLIKSAPIDRNQNDSTHKKKGANDSVPSYNLQNRAVKMTSLPKPNLAAFGEKQNVHDHYTCPQNIKKRHRAEKRGDNN